MPSTKSIPHSPRRRSRCSRCRRRARRCSRMSTQHLSSSFSLLSSSRCVWLCDDVERCGFALRENEKEVFKIQQDRERGGLQNPAREREKEVFKIQQDRERRRYSKSSKREREGGIQNPARQREKEVFKIQQERETDTNGASS